jgi:hypothetical protein
MEIPSESYLLAKNCQFTPRDLNSPRNPAGAPILPKQTKARQSKKEREGRAPEPHSFAAGGTHDVKEASHRPLKVGISYNRHSYSVISCSPSLRHTDVPAWNVIDNQAVTELSLHIAGTS